MAQIVAWILLAVAVVSALPQDPVIRRLEDGLRHQYMQGPDDSLHLVDTWLKVSDMADAARYSPDAQNIYHLFTRENRQTSQPLVMGNDEALDNSNYDACKRTVVLIHGWMDNAVSNFNAVMVAAYLEAEDVNVIVVDWSAGAGTINYATAVVNTPISGEAVARFITWLTESSLADLADFHIIGHALGAHQAGIVGRNLGGKVAYITGLDPAFVGWVTNDDKFQPEDGLYTEIIHTNAGIQGYPATLGHVDFYPNGGREMPGCISQTCDQARSFHYMAESIRLGGFKGSRCASFATAMAGTCILPGRLNMGGREPKTGETGVYHLKTKAFPPFSRG